MSVGFKGSAINDVTISLKEARVENKTSFDKGVYTTTELVGAGQLAYLTLEASGANKDVPYTTDTNYSISDAKLEISGGNVTTLALYYGIHAYVG